MGAVASLPDGKTFDWIERALPDGVRPESLTGYAPVLLFMAELLDVRNPCAQVQRLERDADRALPATPLAKIALGLLTRDMGKVVLICGATGAVAG